MSEEWMTRVEKKIDGLGRRMDGLDGRLEGLDGRLGGLAGRLEGLDTRMDGFEGRMDQLHGRIDGVEARLGHRIDSVEARLGQRIDQVEVRLGSLENGQQKLGVDLEGCTADIRAVAEGVTLLSERMDRGFAEVLARLDDRAAPLEAASRYFATKLRDPETRPSKRQRRKRH